MPLDPGLVKRKIVLIERDLRELRKIGVVPLAKYLKNSQFEVLAERYLERIIGRMIDINYHLLSAEKGIMPVDYYHSFLEMGRAGYLPIGLADSWPIQPVCAIAWRMNMTRLTKGRFIRLWVEL